MNPSKDAGSETAPIVSPTSMEEALRIADDLDLAHERYYACKHQPHDTTIWEGLDRACFITLMAKHVERHDELSTCVREVAHERSQCGEAMLCSSAPCADAILLDDNPIEELVGDECGGPLDTDARLALVACRPGPRDGAAASAP